tara:strand:+ start:6422 stop:7414 length:993 start_codon:yes stop_codon:yes gene_type:complete
VLIIGIESSCDETGLAIYDSEKGMLGHVVNSQHKIHGKYGGVVPELASRDHVLKLVPLLDDLLSIAKKSLGDIDLVAFTNGPGLLGPLLTGASFAKSLAWTLKVPSIEIDHLEAHIFSPMISEKKLKPPFISLLVSGGHTILSSITNKSQYTIIGKTLDDSAGEVFDKVARHLGLPYPGGPEISKASSKVSSSSYTFPRPMLNTTCYDFSFSGLKTHITQKINKTNLTDDQISDVAFDFENAILDVLITKTLKASDELNIKDIVVSGGVSANKKLRERFDKEKGIKNIYFPDLAYSTDNGAMIAYMGWLKFSNQNVNSLEINPKPTSSLI